MKEDWVGVFLVWVFFFGLVACHLVPALLLRKFALSSQKKGWPYFMGGLAMGLVATQFSRLILDIATESFGFTLNGSRFLSLIFFVPAFFILYFAVKYVRQKITGN